MRVALRGSVVVVAVVMALLAAPIPHVGAAPTLARTLLPGVGQFYPVSVRVASAVSIPASGTTSLQMSGVGGIPAAGNVATVALNLTVRGSGGAGGLVAYPSGLAAPATRAASYRSHVDETTMVVLRTGVDGRVVLRNAGSVTATVTADVYGWTSAVPQATAGTTLLPLPPMRFVSWVTVPAGGTHTFTVPGQVGVPTSDAAQVALTLAAHGATAGGLTVYPADAARPPNPQLRYTPGIAAQNLVLTRLSADGRATVHNSGTGEVVIWVDLTGFMLRSTAPEAGTVPVPLAPARIRTSVSIAAGAVYSLNPLGVGGVAASGVAAVGIALTARSTVAGALRAYPSGSPDNGTHTLQFVANLDATAFTMAKLGPDGEVLIKNNGAAAVTVNVDVYAYYLNADRPSAPTNVRAFAFDGGALVTWTPPASDGGANIVAYYVMATPGNRTVTVDGDTTSTGMTGLTNGEEYTFVVWAVNRSATGGPSPSSAPSDPVVPQAPTAPGAPLIVDTYPRDRAVRVSWSPAATGLNGVTKYVVTVNPGGSTVETASNATEAVVGGLTNGIRYTFTVTAVNNAGSAVSPPSRPVAPEPARKPLPPPLIQVIALNQRIDLVWAAPSDGGAPITGYTVRATPGGPTLSIPAGTTAASLTGLANGTAYTVSVTAANVAGTSDPATRTGVTAVATRVPAPPTGVRAAVASDGSVTVSWTPPTDVGTSPIGGFGIRAIPGGAATIAPAGSTEATLRGLDPVVDYSFEVMAVNGSGQSAPSPATPPIKPKLTVKSAPVVLSAAAVRTLRAIRDNNTLEFEQPPAEVTALTPGRVVVLTPSAKAPRGFFGMVTSVVPASGLVVVSTEDASLTDVLTEGGFAVDTPIRSGSVASFQPQTPGVTLSQPTDGSRRSIAGDGSIRLDDGALVINFAHRFAVGDGVDIGKIEATLMVEPHLMVKGNVGLSGVTTDSDIGMTYSATASGTIGPTATWSTDVPLAKVEGTCFYVSIGPLPLTLCPEFTAKIALTVSAGGGVEFTVKAGRRFNVHLHTENASVAAPVVTNDALDGNAPILRPYGMFSATLGVPIEANLYLYNVGGPGAKVEPYIEGKLDTRTTEKCWTISAGVRADAWIRTREVFGSKLDWTLEGLIDEKEPIAEADGPCQGIRVAPELAKTPLGQPVQFTVQSLGGVPTTPITWLVVQGGGTIDANGRYVSTTDTYAIVEAVRPAGGGLPEYRSRAGVVTGNPPPGPPVINRLRPGPFSTEVFWSPPTAVPGQTITQYAIVTSPATKTTYVSASHLTGRITGLTAGRSYEVAVYALAGSVVGTRSEWAGPVTARDALARPGTAVNIAQEGDLDTGIGRSALSGDGRYLFFITTNGSPEAPPEIYRDGGNDLYLLRKDLKKDGEVVLASRGPDGSTPMRVFSPLGWPDLTDSIAPSRDGTKVAFTSGQSGALRNLYVHDIVNRRTTLINNGQTGWAQQFAVSDDASVVSYAGFDLLDTTGAHLFRSVNGNQPQRVDNCLLGTDCDTGRILEMNHDMSGDGNGIVYEETFGTGSQTNTHVLLYDATAGTTRDLTPNPGQVENYHHPVISPDGGTWAASLTSLGVSGVVVKRVDAGRPGPADLIVNSTTPGANPGRAAAFSRDGSVLAFRWTEQLRQPVGYTWSAGRLGQLPGRPFATTGYWVEWGLDISGDGRLVTFHRASCPTSSACNAQPGLYDTVR